MINAGYAAQIDEFVGSDVSAIVQSLKQFVPDADKSQLNAWREAVRILQRTCLTVSKGIEISGVTCAIILEYLVPLESRRIDAVLLLNGMVLVLEFKGKSIASQADVDQAAAYARDLRAYHRNCQGVSVKCVLLLTLLSGNSTEIYGVTVMAPDDLARYCFENITQSAPAQDLSSFLSPDSYRPLPSLIKAARELFESGSLKRIHRAAIATQPTLNECAMIVHDTARKKRRSLILICGVPGAGKTLVGLQLTHAKYLDDLAIKREDGKKPNAAAVFLSGNGPLVEVLQYELKSAGGGGKAFVRGVHDYVKTFTRSPGLVPPQHVLVYDEAQRAFDAAQVKEKHHDLPQEFDGMSEPELFIRFAERVPEWCTVVGLIGSGQEIHTGEEAGIAQWRTAIEQSDAAGTWDIYLPPRQDFRRDFSTGRSINYLEDLELSVTIRFHLATQLYEFVENVLSGNATEAKAISKVLEYNGYTLRISRNLDHAKAYLSERYNSNLNVRYGMLASARDRDLPKHGIMKGFRSPGEVGRGKYGPWYTDGICNRLESVATEFGAQGLEVDGCLLAWGSDFIRENGTWSNEYASKYRDAGRIKDALALRTNAYRVLLTRGRDGSTVFIPHIHGKTEETYEYLKQCGFVDLV